MKLKSYFSATVEAALEQARQELGDEAMLVDTRKAAPEARHMGEYEVVFASFDQPESAAAGGLESIPSTDRPAARRQPAPETGGEVQAELAKLNRQLREMRTAMWRLGLSPSPGRSPNAIRALAILAEAEVDPELAQEITACVEARLAGDPLLEALSDISGRQTETGDRLARVLVAELERRFRVEPSLGRPDAEPRVAALAGPPGSGKTTTLVKLAAAALLDRRPVQLVSMDTYRIAAADELRTYAAILGVGFEIAETGRALDQAIEQHRSKGLVLIDTPGFGPRDADAAADLAAIFARRPSIDIHLVLPASMKPADLTVVVERFEMFRPSKLLFTRIDETSSFGPLFSQAARTGKPVSFLASGQRIPEDLEPASPGWLLSRILAAREEALLFAA